MHARPSWRDAPYVLLGRAQANCTYHYVTGCFADSAPPKRSSHYVPFDVFSQHGPCLPGGVTYVQDRSVRLYTSHDLGKVDLKFKLTPGLTDAPFG